MKYNNDNPIETIRLQLNRMPEKDQNGNYNRFGAQFFTWFIGCLMESSSDPKLRRSGTNLRLGAEESFADYIGQKVSEKIQELFRNNFHY